MGATYFRDWRATDIGGIVIIESYGDGYWLTENRDSGWCKPFYMPAEEFNGEKVGKLSDEQFGEIVEAASD